MKSVLTLRGPFKLLFEYVGARGKKAAFGIECEAVIIKYSISRLKASTRS